MPKYSPKAFETPGDGLVKIGNFLGGSQNAMMRLAERRTSLLARIERNTANYGLPGAHSVGDRLAGASSFRGLGAFGVFVPHF